MFDCKLLMRATKHFCKRFPYVPEPSPLYENNHYHEECLRCNSCGLNLTGPNQVSLTLPYYA